MSKKTTKLQKSNKINNHLNKKNSIGD